MIIVVAVVDDQPIVRAGLVKLLEAEPGLNVAGSAGDGLEAIELVRRAKPDVVLMDVRMPELDGIAATRRIVEEVPRTRVIVLTTFGLDEYVYGALDAGASGFLLKDAEPDHLIASIKLVMTGDALIAPAATRRLVSAHAPQRRDQAQPRELQSLTERERDVFQHLARGLSNAEIAAELFLAEATVKSHVAGVLAKLGARNRVQAVICAYESGFVHADQGSGGIGSDRPG